MKAIQFEVSGNWGHFRKVETNNNPLTHDLITKTALVGLIGAVVGIEREPMRRLFPILCDALIYNVEVKSIIKKQSWGFTLRQASNVFESSPRYMEILSQPKFSIVLACKDEMRTEGIFAKFCEMIKNKKACFTPVLGLHNCPAELNFIAEGSISESKSGAFETLGFVTPNHHPKIINSNSMFSRIGFDKIPTYQTDDFWNLPERYAPIIYPVGGKIQIALGEYFTFKTDKTESQWYLI